MQNGLFFVSITVVDTGGLRCLSPNTVDANQLVGVAESRQAGCIFRAHGSTTPECFRDPGEMQLIFNRFLLIMVPKAGLEPARLAPPPPQDGVSTSSTTSAN